MEGKIGNQMEGTLKYFNEMAPVKRSTPSVVFSGLGVYLKSDQCILLINKLKIGMKQVHT